MHLGQTMHQLPREVNLPDRIKQSQKGEMWFVEGFFDAQKGRTTNPPELRERDGQIAVEAYGLGLVAFERWEANRAQRVATSTAQGRGLKHNPPLEISLLQTTAHDLRRQQAEFQDKGRNFALITFLRKITNDLTPAQLEIVRRTLLFTIFLAVLDIWIIVALLYVGVIKLP